mmetsp:Transcript_39449/g.57956  ORF Transcript_39449/g.57956 Transcript_39449/m.57956 type:complete len:107 (-) Transcript_39449:491-811(-)|eukprot:CAMPEP_0195526392 /NCGR_PEP_ID=MMETSP0794_2-20130614/27437_1 /TAXON_ID=515487 /ORGANISM="Stephanopyxis turris, Strain CCMP 815" /LENGTH=106 /DNA_ID=CAMNT_0040657065 /DNA_START=145 /DNA_END=465 /DNA_ORIENTATION=+
MNSFINKIASYVANEIIIKGLANSRTFQRFAIRTDTHIQTAKKSGQETLDSTLDGLHKATTKAASSLGGTTAAAKNGGPPQPPLRGFLGFISAFGKEIRRDLGAGK